MHTFLLTFNLLLIMFNVTNCEKPKMIVFSGIVTNPAKCWPREEVDGYPRCVAACGKDATCQFCYWSTYCVLCSEGTIKAIPQNKDKIAMKNINEEEAGFCPAGTVNFKYVPPFEEHESHEQPSGFTTATLATTTFDERCPEKEYKHFEPNWCLVLMFSKDLSDITQSDGQKLCADVKGVISGPETEEELDYLIEAAMTHEQSKNISIGLWIDGIQKEHCHEENCFPRAFSFSDPHLSNYTGYDWRSDKKGNVKYGNEGVCLQLIIPKNNTGELLGKVSTARCRSGKDPEIRRIGFVCGARAV